jgi:hypothetical protein
MRCISESRGLEPLRCQDGDDAYFTPHPDSFVLLNFGLPTTWVLEDVRTLQKLDIGRKGTAEGGRDCKPDSPLFAITERWWAKAFKAAQITGFRYPRQPPHLRL